MNAYWGTILFTILFYGVYVVFIFMLRGKAISEGMLELAQSTKILIVERLELPFNRFMDLSRADYSDEIDHPGLHGENFYNYLNSYHAIACEDNFNLEERFLIKIRLAINLVFEQVEKIEIVKTHKD